MRRNGFTLLEVIVALALSAVVVTIAHRVFAAVTEGSRRLDEARAALDREVNARRALAESFGSLDVGGEAGGFMGKADRIEFGTWERAPQGFLVATRATLMLRADTLVLEGGTRLALTDSVTQVGFDYLLEPGAQAVWVREWISPVSAPLAVRVRITRNAAVDTLLLLVGPRG